MDAAKPRPHQNTKDNQSRAGNSGRHDWIMERSFKRRSFPNKTTLDPKQVL